MFVVSCIITHVNKNVIGRYSTRQKDMTMRSPPAGVTVSQMWLELVIEGGGGCVMVRRGRIYRYRSRNFYLKEIRS